MQWTVVVPVKSLPEAKSRLAASLDDPARHHELVRAMRADTVAAIREAPSAVRLLVVADRADGADRGELDLLDAEEFIVQTEPGLNAALRGAAEYASERWPLDGVAALVGDLPALGGDDLEHALQLAAGVDAGFVPDADGLGTTLLTARPGTRLRPQFGNGSAAKHSAGATPIDAAPGLRQDVDTQADLDRALTLGVGPHTRVATTAVTSCLR